MAYNLSTVRGTPAWSTTTPKFGSHKMSAGVVGNAGVDFFLSSTGLTGGTLTTGTIEGWIHTTNAGTKIWCGHDNWYWFGIAATKMTLHYGNGAGEAVITGTSAINDGNWHHVAAVFHSGSASLYVDGNREATSTAVRQVGTASQNTLTLGGFGGPGLASFDFVYGGIDEVRVSSTQRYTGTSYTVPTAAFTDDADTVAIYSLNGNGNDSHVTITPGSFAIDLPVPVVDFAGTYSAPATAGTFAIDLPVPVADFAGTYSAPPTGSFALDLPVPVVAFSGDYTPPVDPTGAFDITLPTPVVEFAGTYFPLETGTFAIDLPAPTVAFAGTYTPPLITGSFAIDLPLPVVEFSGLASAGIGSFAIDLPLPTVVFEGAYGGPYPTDTSNLFDGLNMVCIGTVTLTRAAVVPPTAPPKYDKALPYPEPVMVDGRPT